MRLLLVLASILFASCGSGNDDSYTFNSLQQSFERESSEQRKRSADVVEQMFVTTPKFGRERMVYAYNDALAIMRRCDSVIAFIDAQKNALAKEKSNRATLEPFAHKLRTMLQPGLLLCLVAHATYNAPDSIRLYDSILAKHYNAFTGNKDWEQLHFKGSTAKTQMELSRIKQDIAEAEWMALWALIENANRGCVLKFDPHMGAAIPQSSFLFEGDRFEANLLFLYRPDTPAYKVQEMTMNGQKLEVINEVGRYREIARGVGLHALRGRMSVTGPAGELMTREVKVEYMVMKPLALIETESLRTIFAGKHNRLSVNVWGFMQKDIIVQTDRGTLSIGNDKYDLYVEDTGMVRLIVSAKLRSGKIIPVDTQFLQAILHN